MIKVGDTYQADGNEWKITTIDDEGINLTHGNLLINVDDGDEMVYVYRKFKNGRTRHLDYLLSFDEIKMISEIIDKLKGERE